MIKLEDGMVVTTFSTVSYEHGVDISIFMKLSNTAKLNVCLCLICFIFFYNSIDSE